MSPHPHPVLAFGQTSGRPGLLRGLNSLNALMLVRQEGSITATQIASAIGVSRTAIEAILSDLLSAGWLTRVSPDNTAQLGRPAARYDLGPSVGYVAAIDFDSTRTAASIADFRGNLLQTAQLSVEAALGGDERSAQGVDLLKQTMADAHVDPLMVRCVGVASPGVINAGTITHFGGHGMPDWIGRNLGAEMRLSLDLPVVLEGDSALGALAERRLGAGKGCTSFVYIYSGRRTGAAIISDGRLLRGSHGAVGLIGELPELRWRELETAYEENSGEGFAPILGLGISAMVLAVDPELVLIGGSRRDLIAQEIEEIRANVARRCPIPPRVELGHFGADAVMRGAVSLAMDTIISALSSAVAGGSPIPSPDSLGHLIP